MQMTVERLRQGYEGELQAPNGDLLSVEGRHEYGVRMVSDTSREYDIHMDGRVVKLGIVRTPWEAAPAYPSEEVEWTVADLQAAR
jgi:hypothetical protein